MTMQCTDPLDDAIARVEARGHRTFAPLGSPSTNCTAAELLGISRRGDPCWLCDGLVPIWDSGLCFKCYTWVMDNTPKEATEAEIIEAYRKPAMVQRLIAAIQSL
jgi:hypothetical protein